MTIQRASIFFWILRILATLVMLQTLFFKFSAAPESVYIFSSLGMEPWGRIGTGVVELIASVLILIPRATAAGAVLGLGVMSGALFFHLTRLGIEVMGDHGQLFLYCLIVFLSCALLAWRYRGQLFGRGSGLFRGGTGSRSGARSGDRSESQSGARSGSRSV